MKSAHGTRRSIMRIAHAIAWVSLLGACRDAVDNRVRLDTTGWEAVQVELVGELRPLASHEDLTPLRERVVKVWAHRINRARDAGAMAVMSARDLTEATPSEPGTVPFRVIIDAKVPPPCGQETAFDLSDRLWAMLSHRGDFGIYRLSRAGTAEGAALLRTLPHVTDVSTASALRGLTVVTTDGQTSGDALVEAIGESGIGPFAVQVPHAALPGNLTPKPTEIYLALVDEKPVIDADMVESAELLATRDGIDRIDVRIRDAAVPALHAFTEAELGRHFIVLADVGSFLTAPVIGSRVRDGKLELHVPATQHVGAIEAAAIANVLGSGGLPGVPTLQSMRVACVTGDKPLNWLEKLIR